MDTQSSKLVQSLTTKTERDLMLQPRVMRIQKMRRHRCLILAPMNRRTEQRMPKKASKKQYLMMGPMQASLPSQSSSFTNCEYLTTLAMVTMTVMMTVFCKGMPHTDLKQGGPHIFSVCCCCCW